MRDTTGIKTSRLDLKPLNQEQLRNYLDREEIFIRGIGPASRIILTPALRKAIQMKLLKLAQASRHDSVWITYWLIKVPPEGFGAGMIGFKGCPDQNGEVEIGYGIDPAYRNLGYTTEAVRGMIRWAFGDPRCLRIIAPDTLRSNLASNRVLEKVGMQIYAETPDTLSWCLDKENQITN